MYSSPWPRAVAHADRKAFSTGEAMSSCQDAAGVLDIVSSNSINLPFLCADHPAYWRHALAPAHGEAPSAGKAEGGSAVPGHYLCLSKAHFSQPGGHSPSPGSIGQNTDYRRDAYSLQQILALQGSHHGGLARLLALCHHELRAGYPGSLQCPLRLCPAILCRAASLPWRATENAQSIASGLPASSPVLCFCAKSHWVTSKCTVSVTACSAHRAALLASWQGCIP